MLFSVGCSEKAGKLAPPLQETAKVYETRGIVRSISPAVDTITITHEEIPGFMPAMTMPFEVKERSMMDKVRAGESVRFQLTVSTDDSWISEITSTSEDSLKLPAAETVNLAGFDRVSEGDPMPDFELTDQTGASVTKADYAGKFILLNFVFTRCPLPNYCPLLSRNFNQIDQELRSDPVLSDRVQFLSISFDPFDTPDKLANYGERFGAEAPRWRLATGIPAQISRLTQTFAVQVRPELGTISHGLCTALINPEGRVQKIWRGNAWKAADVISELQSLTADNLTQINAGKLERP